ncbi:AP endonuclease [Streptococcus agalactiae]|nr:AP endonuclease [Streptococcus agalactiae]
MKQEDIILNSIVFKKQLDKGFTQVQLIKLVKDLGFSRFEIRQELLQDPDRELPALKAEADFYDINLYYSANEDLIKGGKVNPYLNKGLKEASQLGAPFIKLNVGQTRNLSKEELEPLKEILKSQTIGIKVENNQDPKAATVENCQYFMTLVKELQIPISFVFDTANWAFINQDLYQAVNSLACDTTYLHCKNFLQVAGKPHLSKSLFEGEIDLTDLLKSFSNCEYLALEYPTELEVLKRDVQRLISISNSQNF